MVNRAIGEMVDIAKRYYLIDCHVDVATDITSIAYYSDEKAIAIQNQGYDVVCRLKSDKHVPPQDVI